MNPGRWQTVAALLGVAAAVVLGVIIVMVLADPPQPAPSPSPTLVAVESPTLSPGASPTAEPTATQTAPATATPEATPTEVPTEPPAATPTAEPTETAMPTATATAELTPSPTAAASPMPMPTPTPTPAVPTAPLREVRFRGLGLDAPDAPEGRSERFVTFSMDGPGEITAAVADVTRGRVRICLWRGDRNASQDRECANARQGGLTRTVTDVAATQWTVSLLGATEQVSPTISFVLRFHSRAPGLTIDRFRFQGEQIENYNGFEAEITADATGNLDLAASWNESYPYEMLVEEIGAAGPPFEAQGSDTTAAQHSAPVVMGRSYRVTFANTTDVADVEVLLRASFSWP
jgi:hypothetical protein